MKIKAIYFTTIVLILNSCTILYYNYRSRFVADYQINNNSDKKEIGQYIVNEAKKEEKSFYSINFNTEYDSIILYGPDYHTLKYFLIQNDSTFTIKFDYFGYNGWRGNPPRKAFIEKIKSKLIIDLGAQELVKTNWSNEKIKKNIPNNQP